MNKQLINPPELFDGAAFGMSQATVHPASGLVFVSGQVDWDQEFQTTHDSVEGQARQAFENLKIALEAAGSSVDQLLLIRLYIRGEWGEHMSTIQPLLFEILGESRPTVTGIGVASLASPDTLVEIEAIASVA